MGLLKTLADAVSGRISHWNSTNNLALKELAERVEALPQSPVRSFYMAALAGSHLLIEKLLFPRDQSAPLLDVNLRSLGKRDFDSLYQAIMRLMTVKLFRANPGFESEVAQGWAKLLGVPEQHEGLRVQLRECVELTEASAGADAIEAWREVCEITGAKDHFDAAKMMQFSEVSSYLFQQSAKAVAEGVV